MTKFTEKEWAEDFQRFVRSEGVPVPAAVSRAILAKVARDLYPSAWRVFGKLLALHSVVGTLSLTICNQFGLNPFGTSFSLSDYFMKFGHSGCMFLCGVIFIGLSLTLSRFLIRPEEVRVLRERAGFEVFGLATISLGVFAALGAEITLAVAAFWLMGAMLGGTAVALVPRTLPA